MRKIAWPWVGTSDFEMGSLAPKGDADLDIKQDSSEPYDMLVTEKTVQEEVPPSTEYEGGIISPVDSQDWDTYWSNSEDKKMEPQKASKALIPLLDDDALVLDVGCGDGRHAKFLSNHGFNVVGIDQSNVALNQSSDEFIKINGDIRYYKFNKKFDGFQALSCLEHIPNYNLALDNIYAQLRPRAYGLIHVEDRRLDLKDFKSSIESAGFKILKESKFDINDNNEKHPYHEFLIEKNELDKVATINIFQDQKILASFFCDIAQTTQEKLAGLQSYPDLKHGSGLLFEYDHPQNVMYHMGNVQYPIDIIFVDESNSIKKIYKNIQPGSLAIFGSSSIQYVLEIRGGLAERLGVLVGNQIQINKGNSNSTLLKISKISDRLNLYEAPIVCYSNIAKTGVYNYNGIPILSLNNKDENINIASSMIKKFGSLKQEIHAFDVDTLSFQDNKLLEQIFKSGNDKNHKMVMVTRDQQEPDVLKLILNHKINNYINKISNFDKSDVIIIDDETSNQSIIEYIKNRYGISNVSLYCNEITKQAGVPVSDSVKKKARDARDLFESSYNMVEDSIENMNTNVAEFEKLQGQGKDLNIFKGQYNQSIKRNSRLIQRYLIKIRDGLKIMNEIKDISSTAEIMGAVAGAGRSTSEAAEEIFALIDDMESPDFNNIVREKTNSYKSRAEDLKSVLDRITQYIDTNIIGIIKLSD